MATTSPAHRTHRLQIRRLSAMTAALLVISTILTLFFGARIVSAVGTLTVRVYTDSDRDGAFDSGEPGVNAVTVSIYNTDNNLVFSNNTDASGLVTFPSIPNGDYRVEVANPSNGLPNGTVVSVSGSTTPGQDNALVFFVTINNNTVQRDVGLRSLDASGIDTGAPVGFRTVVVRAWDDQDANGIQDAGEPGLGGLTLGLYNPSNVLVATATAGPDGTYRFVDNVPANVSNHSIRVTAGIPAGWVLTTQNANFDFEDRRDSDAQLVAGEPRITMPNQSRGVNDDSLDVGFSRGAASGFVWRDLDQNGLRDPGEPFINGVTVELRDASDTLIGTQTTRPIANDPANRAGFFEFVSVPLTATYRVRIPSSEFDNSTDLLFGHATPLNQTVFPPAIGDQGLIDGTTDGPAVIGAGNFLQTPDFTLNATNRRNETSSFGLFAGTVGDFVWHDVNRNGIVDGIEGTLGLANALVFVDLNSNCQIDTGEPQTTTDTNGFYLFDDLPLGVSYRIVLDASNFAPGGALEGLGYTTGAACGSTEGVVIVTSVLDATTPAFLNADFGIVRAEVGNFVWEDENGNGVFDLSETGVQSVTVQLYSAGPDGIFFTGDDAPAGLPQTTNASGIYTVTDIISGTYYATFDLSVLDPAYVASVITPTGWLSVDPQASVSDDVNDVREFVSGRIWRTPVFTIARGSENPGVDAAVYRPAPLSGRVFFDQNGNNQDETSPEPGLANFTVNLRRASDDAVVSTTTTLADGSYTFSSVVPLTYVVEVVRPDPSNWSFVTPDIPAPGDPLASDVDATGRTGVISVTSGVTVTEVDAGLRGNNVVQGYVFFDRDGSFTQTANDLALSSATATLTVTVATANLTTTYTLTATTGAGDPNYSFTGLPGGTSGVTYTLSFDPPDATYTPSVANVGSNDAIDSDGPFIEVASATVGVSNTLDYDQGYWRPVTVRARIFDEITSLPPDNVYSVGDTGITTATVAITTTNGTVTPLSASAIDSTGVVTFTLPPTTTTYWLNVATPAGFLPSPGNSGALEVNTPSPLLADDTAPSPASEFEFGYFRAITVVARVFEELTPPVDNAFAAGDTGIPTATVTITTTGGSVTPLSVSPIDPATGLITFTLVPTDSATPYWVNVAQPAGFERSPGNSGAAEVTPNPGPGQTVGPTGLAFGHYRPVTVVVRVFEELTPPVDNIFAAGDTGITTATVTITTTNGVVTPLSVTAIDSSGLITFTLVQTDSATPYWVNVAQPAGFERSPGNTGAAQVSPNPGPGDTVGPTGLEFGHYRPVTVVARVFEELTPPVDNAFAAGDTGITTATVTITTTNGVVTPLSVSPIDPATGLITFTLAPTDSATPYWVNVAQPAGFERSPGNTSAAEVTPNPGPGQTVGPTGLEFGHYRPVTVVVRVFEELTPPVDNAFAAGDTGITTATVTITTTNGVVTPLSVSAIDSSGLITFTLVPTDSATPYWVNVAQPAGFERSPGNTGAAQVSPNPLPGQTVGPAGLEFGHYRFGTVSGTVFFDRDGDNILFGDSEPGLQGVTVTLVLTPANTIAYTTTTDATGAYTFTSVAPDTYVVRVINPDVTNFQLVTPAGGDNNLQTAVGNDAETAPFAVASDVTITRNAAAVGRSTVTGVVWEDLNGNGTRDTGEGVGALPGVTVNLTVTVNLPGLLSTTIVTTTTTDATGAYTVTDLPGWATVASEVSFTLRFATPSGWFATLDDVGTQPATDDSDGESAGVDRLDDQELARGGTESRDRGFYRPAVIQVRVFEETTSPIDNVYAAGDQSVPGATVTLTPSVAIGGPFGPDSTGVISYTVAPTTTAYTVGVTPPAGYFASPGNTGTATAPSPLTSGQTITPLPFGYYRNGVISGTVWFDTSDNGLFDSGEPTMAGVTVTLFLDPDTTVNGNETSIGTFTTGDNGIYQFTSITPTDVLTPGTQYRIQFTLPAGYDFTTQGLPITTDNNSDAGAGGYTDRFTVGSNETATYVDAGAVGTLTLTGTAWEDLDADGTFDTGEPGLAGVTLTLTVTTSINSTSPVITKTTTSAAGSPNFTFSQLPAGNYQVSVTGRPLGYLLSTVDTLSGTLPATGQNFGLYRTTSVGDRVWFDVNGNGTYQAGTDIGLPNVTVRLRDASTDTVISTTTTLASGDVGFYGFENINPGSYVVEFVAPSGFQTVNNGAGSLSVDHDNDAQTNGRTASFTLVSGQISTTVDAGFVGNGSISGFAWVDENFDDLRNPGENQRIAGVQVTLTITPTGLGAPLTFSTVTDTNGNYTFAGLPPGTFVVTFTKPAGYFDVATRVGSDPTIDSDAPVATGILGAGQALTSIDAGYRTQTRVFLPLIVAPVTPPDLVVEAFTVTPTKTSYTAGEPVLITVKVKNVGGSPTTVGFWVDLYINPSTPPTTANVRWNDVCGISPCYGIAWYVNQALAPGQSITLTSAPGQFAGPQSVWPGHFASGTNSLYVYVDSFNPPVPTGAVAESNETNNRAEITGFIVSGASLSNGAAPGAPSGVPDAPVALPPRRLPEPVDQ